MLALAGCAHEGLSTLSSEDRVQAHRVEQTLGDLKGLTGRFQQTGPDDAVSSGTFDYAPGRLQLDYAFPHVSHLVAANGHIVLTDDTTGAVTHLSLARNPLGLLLRTPISFDNGIVVTSVRRGNNALQLSAAQANNPSQGELTLQFSDIGDHLNLIGFDAIDARQHHVVLHLFDTTSR
ncbi:hypothetical protein A0U93_02625 [Neoasaia chiangmaiensis]|uniref:Outer-membrane lipoprotein carrier protein n=2 Tax=Neoasaia chiangmaiensis TaxID=320497 RepID=A0A1U9KU07_9PROT|nr:hypothetical protein A0U93_02625 [Neoasaia chiangmaiensis]